MNRTERIEIQKEWAGHAALLMHRILEAMRPAFESSAFDGEQYDTIGLLTDACVRSSHSVMCLCAHGMEWDAEMVLRSVFEGTLKFVYLLENRSTFDDRYAEFAPQGWDLVLLKNHQKAKDFLATIADPSAPEWHHVRERRLSAEQEADLLARYDRSRRGALAQQWGFTGLLKALTRAPAPEFRSLADLGWTYAFMSHLQHVDYAGLIAVAARGLEDDAEAASLDHAARLVTDATSCALARALALFGFARMDTAELHGIDRELSELRATFGNSPR